jgi:hypothetical protein
VVQWGDGANSEDAMTIRVYTDAARGLGYTIVDLAEGA